MFNDIVHWRYPLTLSLDIICDSFKAIKKESSWGSQLRILAIRTWQQAQKYLGQKIANMCIQLESVTHGGKILPFSTSLGEYQYL